jgi:hypothetical protein
MKTIECQKVASREKIAARLLCSSTFFGHFGIFGIFWRFWHFLACQLLNKKTEVTRNQGDRGPIF